MISRTPIKCKTCGDAITARIQVGHESEQPVSFACPHCGTLIRLTLILDEPPLVKKRWEENCESSNVEGKIVNIGAGFTIPAARVHEDMYFPMFDAPMPSAEDLLRVNKLSGRKFFDAAVETGTLPRAADDWQLLERALRLHRTGQYDKRDSQLAKFWGANLKSGYGVAEALLVFLLRFMEPSGEPRLKLIFMLLVQARNSSPYELERLMEHYDTDLRQNRFADYSEIFSEYFAAYGEFSQTLVYARRQIPIPEGALATSSAFDKTRMFYGNAFELLGSNLDVPAALNNILAGRSFDRMDAMDLRKYRGLNKANRTNCFPHESAFRDLFSEYDSIVRNASHHRWFKLSDDRTVISYRSGGEGALHKMSYAEYLLRCNRLIMQIMLLCCLEIIFVRSLNRAL